jgi:hypothetical protein
MLTTCLECGELAEQPYCDLHKPKESPKPETGKLYDWNWQKLSKRARRLQPFCSDCLATEDLQADHSPEAWERKAAGKPIRLEDIDVVCGDCNRKRGAARGDNINHTRGIEVEGLPPHPRADSESQLLSASTDSKEDE